MMMIICLCFHWVVIHFLKTLSGFIHILDVCVMIHLLMISVMIFIILILILLIKWVIILLLCLIMSINTINLASMVMVYMPYFIIEIFSYF